MRRRLVLVCAMALVGCGTTDDAIVPSATVPATIEAADIPLESLIPTLPEPQVSATEPSRDAATAWSTPDRGTQIQIVEPPPPPTTPPYVWTGEIPTAPNGSRCSVETATVITSTFARYGASYDTQVFFLLVAGRESGCDTSAHNGNAASGDDSYSWCQLNALAGHFGPNGVLAGWDRWRMLVDLQYASDGCATMWQTCGRGPWNNGNYSCSVPAELR